MVGQNIFKTVVEKCSANNMKDKEPLTQYVLFSYEQI
jgi:hypothetical protein